MGKFLGRVGSKVLCTGMSMAADMGVSVATDAVLGNCFVAGTQVWVLKEGIDPEQANAALAAGADWEELAEPVAIEEVETGNYALSRPDDDPDGELGFHAVTRLYRNTPDELVRTRKGVRHLSEPDPFSVAFSTARGPWCSGRRS